MENQFDILSKAVASGLSRRTALQWIGAGVAGGTLSFLGGPKAWAGLARITSARSQAPTLCHGKICGTFTGDCSPHFGFSCFCFQEVGGRGRCVDDYFCSTAEACSTSADCPAGKKCYTGGCCGDTCGPDKCTGQIQGLAVGKTATGRTLQ